MFKLKDVGYEMQESNFKLRVFNRTLNVFAIVRTDTAVLHLLPTYDNK